MANEANSPSLANSYLDFAGLARLRGEAHRSSSAANRETAQQFEAMFIQMMMKSMRDASFKGELLDSSALETFQGMQDREISVQLAKRGGFGLADMLEKQFAQQPAAAPAADELALRQSMINEKAGLPLTKPAAEFPVATQKPVFNIKRNVNTGYELQRDMPLNAATKSTLKD
jgi:Rod binding domain-containing protein